MKIYLAPILLAIIIVSSCSKLNIHEITSMEKLEFDDLQLYSDYEPNELRIDIIRKINVLYVDEDTYTEEPVPYHPLGMNLGNGLFYDLNGNLSLRLDFLLDFSADQPFEIKKNINSSNDKHIYLYTYINDGFTITKQAKNTSRHQYHIENSIDSTAFLFRDRFLYSIINSDTSMLYRRRNKKLIGIYKLENGRFYLGKNKKNRECRLYNKNLSLAKDYQIHLSNNKKSIIINSWSRMRNGKIPLFTIEKSKNALFIYNRRNKGKRIEFIDQDLEVTGTGLKTIRYALIMSNIVNYSHKNE